jgi:hypothetical protein
MIKRWLRKWLFREASKGHFLAALAPNETNADSVPETAHCRVGLLSVMNGRVLEVCTFKRNPHGPDWTTTYWILNDTQSLAEQVAVVLTMKGLEK